LLDEPDVPHGHPALFVYGWDRGGESRIDKFGNLKSGIDF
jgi:hypothetical protein